MLSTFVADLLTPTDFLLNCNPLLFRYCTHTPVAVWTGCNAFSFFLCLIFSSQYKVQWFSNWGLHPFREAGSSRPVMPALNKSYSGIKEWVTVMAEVEGRGEEG